MSMKEPRCGYETLDYKSFSKFRPIRVSVVFRLVPFAQPPSQYIIPNIWSRPRVDHASASASAASASASSSSLSRVVDVDRAFVALRRRAVRRLELVRELLQSGVPEAAHGKSGVALLLHDALQVRDGVRRPPVLWSICAAAGEEIEPVGLRNHFEVEYKKKSEGTVLIYGWATGMN
jgi:hypothetical protein